MHWNFDTSKPYFVFDPEGHGLVYFETEVERDAYAQTCIQDYLDTDGWSEEVMHVLGGVMTHRAQEGNVELRPDDIDENGCDSEGHYWPVEHDKRCTYKLLPVISLTNNDS